VKLLQFYSATSFRTRPKNDVDDCPPPLPAPPDEEEEEEEDEEEEEEESRYFRTVSKRRIRMTPFVSLKTFRQHCSEKETTQAQGSCVRVSV
jgi:hypothetical protein